MKPARIDVTLENGPRRQPDLPAPMREAVMQAVAVNRDKPGALLPILHAVQEEFGYVPESSLPLLNKRVTTR